MRESAVNAHRRDSQFTALHKSNKWFTNIVQHAKHITLSGQLPRESTTSRIHHRTTHTHPYTYMQTGSKRKLSKLVPVLLKWNCNLEHGTSAHQSEESDQFMNKNNHHKQNNNKLNIKRPNLIRTYLLLYILQFLLYVFF